MKFKYTALTHSSQKVDGVLEAQSKEEALGQLHKMQLSIVSLNAFSENDYQNEKKESPKKPNDIKTFDFKAQDAQKKEIEGTIDAKTIFEAYKRLVTEYEFKVSQLHPEGQAAENTEVLLKDLQNKLENEEKTEGTPISEENGAQTQSTSGVIEEIDKLIGATKSLLAMHQNLFSQNQLKTIQEAMQELERIRSSNNSKHIKQVSRKLLDLIKNPEKAEQDPEKKQALKELIGKLNTFSLFSSKKNSSAKEDSFFQKILKKSGLNFKRKSNHQKKGAALKKELLEEKDELESIGKELGGEKITESTQSPPSIIELIQKTWAYLSASKIVKAKRKEDLIEAWEKRVQKEKKGTLESAEKNEKRDPNKKDFTLLFMEIDSFTSWLLFFYIVYFFLAGIAIEKHIGLPTDFVLRTLESPLLINVSLFLLFTHLFLKLKIKFFRQNAIGSLFLFGLNYGILILTIANF